MRLLDVLVPQYVLAEPAAEAARDAIEHYLDEILNWTRDSNLVARGDLARLVSRHVAESLAVLPVLDRLAPKRLLDVGSGAGFPAIPIAILRPDWAVTLAESRHRKGLFLQRVVNELGLENVSVFVGRAEKLALESDVLADVATARAVAVVTELLPWLQTLVRPGGHAVLFKGSSHEQELSAWRSSADPDWEYLETVSIPDQHLHFLTFLRTQPKNS